MFASKKKNIKFVYLLFGCCLRVDMSVAAIRSCNEYASHIQNYSKHNNNTERKKKLIHE